MSATSRARPVTAEPLERLHALLVEAVRRRRDADPHASPVTVAEIYQELVPYRSVRSALGLDMNADYEHALLRLLSGEGRLARVEPAAAREQMERELESPNPNVALYRKFAGCDVWLLPSGAPTPAWVVEHLAETEPDIEQPAPEPAVPTADDPSDVPDAGVLPAPPSAGAERAREQEPPRIMTKEQEMPAAGAGAASAAGRRAGASAEAGQCAFCDSALPSGRPVRFCPFCGADQSQRPCAVCGEPLQQEWAYCIACGEAAAGAET